MRSADVSREGRVGVGRNLMLHQIEQTKERPTFLCHSPSSSMVEREVLPESFLSVKVSREQLSSAADPLFLIMKKFSISERRRHPFPPARNDDVVLRNQAIKNSFSFVEHSVH